MAYIEKKKINWSNQLMKKNILMSYAPLIQNQGKKLQKNFTVEETAYSEQSGTKIKNTQGTLHPWD